MAATTIQRALTCSPRAVAMIASAIVPRTPTRTQGPCVRRGVVMACSVPAGFCFADHYALATEHRKAQGPSMRAGGMDGPLRGPSQARFWSELVSLLSGLTAGRWAT